jgi:hypothetical protein
MTSRLQQLVALIQERVDDARAALETPLTAVTWLYGHRLLQGESALPRVCWVRTVDQGEVPAQRVRHQTARMCLWVEVVAHCFGADEEAAEVLRDEILVAAHQEAGTSFDVDRVRVEWDAPSWLTQGEYCAVTLTFLQPAQEPALTTVTIATVDTDSDEAAPEGQLQCGDT